MIENLKELLWIDHRLTNTLDELLTVRGLLNLMADEFEKIPNAINENSPDNRVELLFNCYRRLSGSCFKDLREISINLERQIKKMGVRPLTLKEKRGASRLSPVKSKKWGGYDH